MTDTRPYNSYSDYLIERYGHRVYRIGVDAGFSCPNRKASRREGGCVYCDSQGAVAVYHRKSESGFDHASGFEKDIDEICPMYDALSVREQIEKGMEFVRRRYKAQHFALYLQSYSNTFAPVEKLRQIYDNALEDYDFDAFIVSTRPDCIDEKKLQLLSSYRRDDRDVCLELGLQSGDDEILRAMNRGHDVRRLVTSALLAKSYGLEVCLHILTGFPGEDYERLQKTVDVINEVEPTSIKIHNLNIASSTALYEAFLGGEVTAPSATRHIANTVYVLRRINPKITIERLIAETPSHRLASPRRFPDKNRYLRLLESYMIENNYRQGDLYR